MNSRVVTCKNLFRKRYGEIKDRFERKLLRFSHTIKLNSISFPFSTQSTVVRCSAQYVATVASAWLVTKQKIANPFLGAPLVLFPPLTTTTMMLMMTGERASERNEQ